MYYEHKKHDGSLPIVGVNTFLSDQPASEELEIALARSTEEEKRSQLDRLHQFQSRNQADCQQALQRLKQAVVNNENVFAELMHAVRYCSLGQITNTFFEVGGQYRRTM